MIAIDFSRKIVLIGGTSYAGEIKKAVFGYLNFLLPPKGVLPMHCSANADGESDAALFSAFPAPARPHFPPTPPAP